MSMTEDDFINILGVDCYRNSNNGGLNDVTRRMNLTSEPYCWPSKNRDKIEDAEEVGHFDYVSMCSIYVVDLKLFIPAHTLFRRYCIKESLAEFHNWWRTESIEIYPGKHK